jgi:hypothetical protein
LFSYSMNPVAPELRSRLSVLLLGKSLSFTLRVLHQTHTCDSLIRRRTMLDHGVSLSSSLKRDYQPPVGLYALQQNTNRFTNFMNILFVLQQPAKFSVIIIYDTTGHETRIGRTAGLHAKLKSFCVRFLVFTTASMKMTFFWDIAPCSLVEIHRRFGGAYCIIALIMEEVGTSETSVYY